MQEVLEELHDKSVLVPGGISACESLNKLSKKQKEELLELWIKATKCRVHTSSKEVPQNFEDWWAQASKHAKLPIAGEDFTVGITDPPTSTRHVLETAFSLGSSFWVHTVDSTLIEHVLA